jgi:Zn-dependent alcohol dehydrogenase
MRAAVQFEVPGRLEIVDVDIDQPQPHEVLIRTVASGLCHSDLHFPEGKYQPDLPVVLGHEAAGIVEAVGDAVIGIRPGDHVVTCLSTFCGSCAFCLSGRPALCLREGLERGPDETPRLSYQGEKVNAFARLGGFAEKMLVHEHSVVPARRDMPLDRAALVGCAVTTGVGAVVRTAQVPAGSTVAVSGAVASASMRSRERRSPARAGSSRSTSSPGSSTSRRSSAPPTSSTCPRRNQSNPSLSPRRTSSLGRSAFRGPIWGPTGSASISLAISTFS